MLSAVLPNPASEYTDWYGSKDFEATARFVRERTDDKALFAYSLCNPTLERNCEFDLRPAVFMERRFLALDLVEFFQPDTEEKLFRDVTVSRSVGSAPVQQVLDNLRMGSVSHVLLNRSRVTDEWIRNLIDNGGLELFRNDEYVVIELADA